MRELRGLRDNKSDGRQGERLRSLFACLNILSVLIVHFVQKRCPGGLLVNKFHIGKMSSFGIPGQEIGSRQTTISARESLA